MGQGSGFWCAGQAMVGGGVQMQSLGHIQPPSFACMAPNWAVWCAQTDACCTAGTDSSSHMEWLEPTLG